MKLIARVSTSYGLATLLGPAKLGGAALVHVAQHDAKGAGRHARIAAGEAKRILDNLFADCPWMAGDYIQDLDTRSYTDQWPEGGPA